ncbi:hypothetical protein CROQUDRAFT_132807 [Cronartium quercuum f. sp. fusiforme G11]|uniref:Transmembrane protein n=1 Tax=Cronartium quercuum f. sp. fusiforme G11 TaxID=708437 RepID=A0A9P6TCQ6_9BASI|nr:hypothetical protein CROQUDRAFT_132807 [Cronartium quercuum f. sp. fusiforme G11]
MMKSSFTLTPIIILGSLVILDLITLTQLKSFHILHHRAVVATPKCDKNSHYSKKTVFQKKCLKQVQHITKPDCMKAYQSINFQNLSIIFIQKQQSMRHTTKIFGNCNVTIQSTMGVTPIEFQQYLDKSDIGFESMLDNCCPTKNSVSLGDSHRCQFKSS